MMNKIKFLILLSAILAALSACGSKDGPSDSPSQESSAGSTQPSVSAPQLPVSETPPPNIVVEDDSQPPREGMVRSRLTNEWVDAGVAATRPIAVVIPNEINALPHYSLSEASILYEANVEYRMTRMMQSMKIGSPSTRSEMSGACAPITHIGPLSGMPFWFIWEGRSL